MIQGLINFLLQNNIIATVFYKVFYMSIVGSCVGILISIIRKIFDKKILAEWKCVMWGIFILTLLVPFRFEIKTEFEYKNKFINNLETIPQIARMEKQENNLENDGKILNSNLEVSELLSQNTEDTTEKSIIKKPEIPFKEILILIIIPFIWASIALTFIISLVIGYLGINKKNKNNKCNDIIINGILKDALEEMNIKKNIQIYYQNYNKLTSIFGILNSKILISKEVLNLDDKQIKYIFMHELAHFKRKDLIFNLIMLLTLSIHFFNPIVWLIFKQIREDIELAADEAIVSKMNKNEAKEYGLTLIHMLELNQTNDYAVNFLCISDTEKNMRRRIKMIKNPLKSKLFSTIFVVAIIAIIASIVFIKVSGKESIILPIDSINSLNQNYEHLSSAPKEYTSFEEYQNSWQPAEEYKDTTSNEVTEEEMINLISEEEAIKIGKSILDKIGYIEEEISTVKLEKNVINNSKYDYQIRTINGLWLYINAENGKFASFVYNNLIKEKFENEKLSNEELKTLVLNLYKTLDFLEEGYEFYTCNASIRAMGEGDANSSDYKQYTKEEYSAVFYQKQASGILNKYNKISISFYIVDGKALISDINHHDDIKLYQVYQNPPEYVQEDNEIKISEEMAIQIAKDKDSSISNSKIKKVRTEIINNETNYNVWAWENGYTYQELYNFITLEGSNAAQSYPRFYYDKYYIRNTYEVVIIYDLEDKTNVAGEIEKLGKVYYVDVTTGEILGGRVLSHSDDIRAENDYLFDEEDNYTVYKTTYYDRKDGEKIYEYNYELSDEMKSQFYIKKDEKPNTVSYNIY